MEESERNKNVPSAVIYNVLPKPQKQDESSQKATSTSYSTLVLTYPFLVVIRVSTDTAEWKQAMPVLVAWVGG